MLAAALQLIGLLIKEIERQVDALAKALNVVGLMNVQFAIQGEQIFVLEVNPRASRTVPFVSKCIGRSLAKIAARCMAGTSLAIKVSLVPLSRSGSTLKKRCFHSVNFPVLTRFLAQK